MSTLAIIPAKRHSVGVPDKNWKAITPDGRSCTGLAVKLGLATCGRMVLSTDMTEEWVLGDTDGPVYHVVRRPPDLPDTMLAVVQHALEAVPGPDDEIIVLLQPSSPLRTVETVRKAIRMLEDDPTADSVVSVSPAYPKEWLLDVIDGHLEVADDHWDRRFRTLGNLPDRRQDCVPLFKRDGVVYAFRRKAFIRYGNIYGQSVLPIYTPPAEALSIDTPADWDEAVRRLSNSAGSLGADTSARP